MNKILGLWSALSVFPAASGVQDCGKVPPWGGPLMRNGVAGWVKSNALFRVADVGILQICIDNFRGVRSRDTNSTFDWKWVERDWKSYLDDLEVIILQRKPFGHLQQFYRAVVHSLILGLQKLMEISTKIHGKRFNRIWRDQNGGYNVSTFSGSSEWSIPEYYTHKALKYISTSLLTYLEEILLDRTQ